MVGWVSVYRLVGRGWGVVFLHRDAFIRLAALPALLWLFVKALGALLPNAVGGVSPLGILSGAILTLFVVDWFRFSLRAGAGTATAPGADPLSLFEAVSHPARTFGQGGRMLARGFLYGVIRVAVVVLAGTAILLPPTLVLAAGSLAVTGQLGDHVAAGRAVSWALPVAALLASPLLVRFYIYYAALAAGRPDVRARDAWRWSRGKSLWLLALLALSLAPGVAAVTLAGVVTGFAAVAAHVVALPLFFLSLGVMATVTARAVAGLVVLPIIPA